jgi:hypothetical protein
VREVEDIIHWETYDMKRARTDREVVDHIITKLRPKKKKGA